MLASWGPLVSALGALLGRLGNLFGRLGAILRILERCFGDSRPSWIVLGASWGPLGPSWGPLGSEKVTREDAPCPDIFGNLGSSGLRTEA